MLVFEIYISIILLIGSIYDCKYYKLPVWLLTGGMTGAAVGIGYCLVLEKRNLTEVLCCLLPGMVSLILSYITREQIGYGDGMLLLAIGGCMGAENSVWIVFAALLGSFVVSIFFVVFRRAGKDRRLPFVPFLFLGTVVVLGRRLIL